MPPSLSANADVAEEAQLHRQSPFRRGVRVSSVRASSKPTATPTSMPEARLLRHQRADRLPRAARGPSPPAAGATACSWVSPNQPPCRERLVEHALQLRRRARDELLRVAQPLGVLQRGDRGVDLRVGVSALRHGADRSVAHADGLSDVRSATAAGRRSSAGDEAGRAGERARPRVDRDRHQQQHARANTAAPSRSPSTSRPRADVAAGPGPPTRTAAPARRRCRRARSGTVSATAGDGDPAARRRARNSSDDDERTVAALEQPAEDRDREQRDERVAAVLRRRTAPVNTCHQLARRACRTTRDVEQVDAGSARR